MKRLSLALVLLASACAAPVTTTPTSQRTADGAGCYALGQNPNPGFACTPYCWYAEGQNTPYRGPLVTDPCIHQCSLTGQLGESCLVPREEADAGMPIEVDVPVMITADASTETDVPDVMSSADVPVISDVTDVVDAATDVSITDVGTGRCATNIDCDDRDGMTEDACDMASGICHHTRTVVEAPPFDPASRQDLANLCEAPLTCATGNGARLSSTCSPGSGRHPWWEDGYALGIDLWERLTTPILHVAPRLFVGDPRDTFRVVVSLDSDGPTVIDRAMSVTEIEHGFDIPAGPANYRVTIRFLPVGRELLSRTLQWALPVGSVTDSLGRAKTTCLQVGLFTPVPQHGFLHLEENAGRLVCTGTPLRADVTSGIMVGWVRTLTNPTLYFVNAPPSPYRNVFEFANTREAIDWVATPVALMSLCTATVVITDAELAAFTGAARVAVGIRPGVYVQWTDASGGHHEGIADRRFTLLEVAWPVEISRVCTIYTSFVPDPLRPCPIDVTAYLSRYTIVTPPAGTVVDPHRMFADARVELYNR